MSARLSYVRYRFPQAQTYVHDACVLNRTLLLTTLTYACGRLLATRSRSVYNFANSSCSMLTDERPSSCNGGTEDVSVTLGGSTSASETVENSITAGFSLEGEGLGINAGTTFTHSSTTTSETSHSVTYQVPAGRQAVFVAGYAMESVTANVEMTYSTRQAGHFDWFVLNATLLRPIADNIVYNVYESACGEHVLTFMQRQDRY